MYSCAGCLLHNLEGTIYINIYLLTLIYSYPFTLLFFPLGYMLLETGSF